VDGRSDSAPNCEASISKQKWIEREPIRIPALLSPGVSVAIIHSTASTVKFFVFAKKKTFSLQSSFGEGRTGGRNHW